jgi:selenide, water dikinase
MEKPKLTQLSRGSGCGCKIAPADLEVILSESRATKNSFHQLIVGHESSDDAAVWDNENGTYTISTTDFFTPIVDDAFDFGRIASANAISDVYAMGGLPIMAVAILGWPIEQLGSALAGEVLAGARDTCAKAKIPLAGGHSIDSKEPFFGLAVTGTVNKAHLKRNNTAKDGDLIYLTKPIGVGMLSTAMKRGLTSDLQMAAAIEQMARLNDIGNALGKLDCVHAMTDVTGFGLLGHLIEMCEGAGLGAEIVMKDVPVLDMEIIEPLLVKFIMPDNTMRNFKSFGPKCSKLESSCNCSVTRKPMVV